MQYQQKNSKRADKETNNNDNTIVSHEEIMPPKKRIFNPITGIYYKLREKTTDYGDRGEILGRWSSKKRKK